MRKLLFIAIASMSLTFMSCEKEIVTDPVSGSNIELSIDDNLDVYTAVKSPLRQAIDSIKLVYGVDEFKDVPVVKMITTGKETRDNFSDDYVYLVTATGDTIFSDVIYWNYGASDKTERYCVTDAEVVTWMEGPNGDYHVNVNVAFWTGSGAQMDAFCQGLHNDAWAYCDSGLDCSGPFAYEDV